MLLPLFLNLENRRVVVVGAGAAAEKKIDDLVRAKANVMVIAPHFSTRIAGPEYVQRAYKNGDLEGAWLAVSATGKPEVARAMRAEADEKRVWLLALDDAIHTCLYSAGVVRRGPMTIAISSSGDAPALVRLLREVLERALPGDRWVEAARALREKWKRDRTPHADRFAELVRLTQAERSGLRFEKQS